MARLFGQFELTNVFAMFSRTNQTSPPTGINQPDDTRRIRDVIAHPNMGVYDPNSLNFPNRMKPVVPGNGGYPAMGLGMVQYDDQPQWDRNAVELSGPVVAFMRQVLFDNRVKHL